MTERVAEPGAEYTKSEPTHGLVAEKEKIAAGGEYNLSGERYRETLAYTNAKFPLVELGEVCKIYQPKTISQKDLVEDGEFLVFGANGIIGRYNKYNHEHPEVLVTCRGATCGTVNKSLSKSWITGNAMVVTPRYDDICKIYLFHLLRHSDLTKTISGSAQPQITRQSLAPYRIPLPPLEVQKEIVAEIEGYQKVIDGAQVVVENYRPHIVIDPEWPRVELGEVCTIVRGSSPRPKGDSRYYGGPIPRLMVADITRDGMYSTPQIDTLTEEGATKSRPMKKGDIIITVSGNPGLPTILAADACIHDGFVGLRDIHESVSREYLYWYLLAQHETNRSQSIGAVFKNLTTHQVKEFKIPLPPLEIQQAIASEIEAERALVATNSELIERFEKKIRGGGGAGGGQR